MIAPDISTSFRGALTGPRKARPGSTNPESRDSESGPEPVIGRRRAPTRWDHPGM